MFTWHTAPHWPQLRGSVPVFVSQPFCALPSQSAVPIGQGEVHAWLTHRPLAQSVPSLHAFPPAHLSQIGPPQSTSVSIPSSLPLVHGDLPHTPFTQVRLWQSGPSAQ